MGNNKQGSNSIKREHDIKTKIYVFAQHMKHANKNATFRPQQKRFTYSQRATETCLDCGRNVLMDYRANYKICPACKTETPIKD